MSNVLSFRETAKLAREYLEVAFHLILYLREVYPSTLFRQVKKYDSPVWQSRNPALTEYLGRVLECIEEEMLKGTVRRAVLVIKEATPSETPLERYVFDFEWLIPSSDFPQDGSADFRPSKNGLARGDVEDLFRACLRKLNGSTAYLKKLPSEVTFAVVLEMKEDAAPPESKAARRGDYPAEWIPAETRHTSEREGGKHPEQDEYQSTISPVHGVRLGMLSMDIRVEETAEKFRLDELTSSGEYFMSSSNRPTIKRQYGSRKPATTTPALSIDSSSSSSQQAPSSSPSRVVRSVTSSVSSSAWIEALQDSTPSSDLDMKGKGKESLNNPSSTPPTSSQSAGITGKRSMRERKASPVLKETKKPSSDLRSFFSRTSPPSKRRRLSPPPLLSESSSMSRQTSTSSSTSASSSSTTASSLSSSSSTSSRKPLKLSQLYLDPFDTPGRSTLSCATCSLSYSRTPEDLNFHEKFHRKCVAGIEWNIGEGAKKGVTVLEEDVEWDGKEGGKVLMVDWKGTEINTRRRLNDVMDTIDTELSSTSLTPSQLDSSKFFLFLTPNRKIVACAVVERIKEAYQVVPPPQSETQSTSNEDEKRDEGLIKFGDDSSSIFCSPTPLPTILGVHRIWTSTSSRRSGLATKLLDHMARSYVYACPIGVGRRTFDVAFSQPTGKGMELARRWTGSREFKVFVD
ncbi:hypothetical protein JCM5353_002498 [Sporobolomyces roseus]